MENSTEKGTDAETENVALEETETPQETMERMYQALNDQLAEDLLEVILQQSPYFFENWSSIWESYGIWRRICD